MTIIKQVAVTSRSHLSNLSKYLNNEKALMRESQHLVNERRWDEEMDSTREVYGHNVAGKTGAENTFMYHQVIAFNPDECDMNGGKMTPKLCMEFANEWVRSRYPNQEAIWVLHKEHCREDGSERYAVHLGVNRTNLEIGKRLNEGRSRYAKIERANAMRDMDRKWGLHQVRANERNSRVHARQPTRAEKEMTQRGAVTDKRYVRECIKSSAREARTLPAQERKAAFTRFLDQKGISIKRSKSGRDLSFKRRSTGRTVNGVSLGRGFGMVGIMAQLGLQVGKAYVRSIEKDMEL